MPCCLHLTSLVLCPPPYAWRLAPHAALYIVSCASHAHRIRAFLFANATTAIFVLRRACTR
jgi:hypothetical protein